MGAFLSCIHKLGVGSVSFKNRFFCFLYVLGSGHPLNPILSTQVHGPRIRNNRTLPLVTVGAARKRHYALPFP